MDISTVLQLLLHGNQLKNTPRTGWIQRGVADAENVAAHSFGVVFVAMILVHLLEESMDLGRVLAMATIHDLPESLTTDIPTPAWRFLPPNSKKGAEQKAMDIIFEGIPFASHLLDLWEELIKGETAESRLVHDADKLDMYLQALIYEQQTGNQRLAEFWQKTPQFYLAKTQEIYDHIRSRRNE